MCVGDIVLIACVLCFYLWCVWPCLYLCLWRLFLCVCVFFKNAFVPVCVCVYVVPPSHLCICACVRVFVCPPCVLVWVLLSDCHGLLTQTFTQLCSLVADLTFAYVCLCACAFSLFLVITRHDCLWKPSESLPSLKRERGLAINSDLFFPETSLEFNFSRL